MTPVSTSPMPGAAMPGFPEVESQGAPLSLDTSVPAPLSTTGPP